jgi:hypothetical protein
MPRRLLAVLTPIVVVALAAAAPAPAQALPTPTTPELIERASLGKADELRMLAYAIGRPDRLPARFRSAAPWDGTLHLRRLRTEAPRLRDAAARREVLGIVGARRDERINTEPSMNCSVLSLGPNPQAYVSEYFYIEYPDDVVFQGGLTIEDYAESLDGAWEREINEFGFAAPPIHPDAPEGKYNVRVGPLGAGLYGFVDDMGTYAGEVGDNPNTPWVEDDAAASCMGLNSDYENGFEQLTVGTARQRLDATTAHEFFHSIQYGYGALDLGDHEPDSNFVEGQATWMEDEAYDSADDNHNYLYPEFRDSMGEHEEGSPYSYFLTWRGLTERFGASTAGPSEDVMQRFWEIISREEYGQMDALEQAYSPTGIGLSDGYHDYAIAARFLKACGGRYVLPHCFEEADAYADVAGGRPEPDGSIDQVTGSYGTEEEPAEIEDNLTLNWVDLPAPDQEIEARLDNKGDGGGALRMSVICDTGSNVRVSVRDFATPDEDAVIRFDPRGCQSRPSAVITNEKRTGGHNPDESTFTPYVLRTDLAPADEPVDLPPPETQPAPPPPPPVTPFIAPPPPVACAAGSRLGRATAFARARGLRFAFRPRGGSRVGIDVFQSSIGNEVVRARLVARFRGRQRSFTWNGRSNLEGRRVRDGYLFVRFRARNGSGMDVKRTAVVRRRGLFRRGPAFATADRCATLASFKLLRPVFGGETNRSIGVSYRVNRVARVTLEVIEQRVVVARYREGFREPGRTFRLRVSPRRFVRGNVTFRLRVEREGARPSVTRLVARKL